jgi:glyoxylate reductase
MTEGPRVFVTDSMAGLEGDDAGSVLAPLRERTRCRVWEGPGAPPPDVLREALHECEGLLCLLTDRIDADLLAGCPLLRVISSCSVGVDHIDLDATRARGIRVGNTPGVLTETTADLAFALMLAASRRVPEAERFARSGAWTPERRWELDMFLGRDLHGATLGLIGLGPIGRAVARRAEGFGMRVLGWNRTPRELPGIEPVALDELLARSDFVSIHVALSDETRGLLDEAALSAMKPGAILVNTARGGIVDEAALVASLRAGHLAAAAMDVFAEEPIPPDHPLLALDNVVVTPHIGSASVATRRRMGELAVANLLAGLEGRPLPHSVC